MEEKRRQKLKFESTMTPLQRTLGWLYLPVHVIVIPVLVMLYHSVSGKTDDTAWLNLIYYAVGVLFVMTVMLRYLRAEFETLLNRLPFCLLTMAWALLVIYALNTVATLILMALGENLSNPNNAEVMQLATRNYGIVKGLAVFIAPIVEEVLFRGVLFGSIRRRSRGWAYAVSAVVFSLYHVWQYAVSAGDWTMLLYAVQYLPISVVLAWCYERSGSLWTNIFYHMGFNAASFAVLQWVMS